MNKPKTIGNTLFAMLLSTYLVLSGPGAIWMCLGSEGVEAAGESCLDARTGECCAVTTHVPRDDLASGNGCELCLDLRIDVGKIDALATGDRKPGVPPVFTDWRIPLQLETKHLETASRILALPRAPPGAPSPLDLYLNTVVLRI